MASRHGPIPVCNKTSARVVLVANERAKLTASFINTIAGSVFGVGGLAPIFAVFYSGVSSVPTPVVFGISLVCWIASVALHMPARRYLGELA